KELAAKADNVPLGAKYAGGQVARKEGEGPSPETYQAPCESAPPPSMNQGENEGEGEAEPEAESGPEGGQPQEAGCGAASQRKQAEGKAFSVAKGPEIATGPRSPEYARVLDHYLSRLAVLKQNTQALALYRRELDRNPNDPGLYQRLAEY